MQPRRALQAALALACLVVLLVEIRNTGRAAEPAADSAATSPPPAPATSSPLAPGEDARCLWGAGFWCSGLPEAQTCLQQKRCASLPPAVHAADNTKRFATWLRVQRRLREKVVEDSQSVRRRKVLVMVGDSITEALSGFSLGAWHKTYYSKYFPRAREEFWGKRNITVMPYGIGGDRTEHLLWRITRGEYEGLPPPDAVVTLIGTNNLAVGHTVEDIAFGVRAVLQALQGVFPSVPVVAMSVLPRADCRPEEVANRTCEPSRFAAANDRVKGINKLVQGFAGEVGSVFLDCHSVAVNGSADSLSAANFPDHLHPSLEGYKLLWNECLLPLLQTHPDLKDRFQLP